jgi:hypothetical protein
MDVYVCMSVCITAYVCMGWVLSMCMSMYMYKREEKGERGG